MQFLRILLLVAACFLGFIAASPLAPRAENTTVHNTDPEENSLQLVFGTVKGKLFWHLWQGPIGVPIQMCGDKRFTLVWSKQVDAMTMWPHPISLLLLSLACIRSSISLRLSQLFVFLFIDVDIGVHIVGNKHELTGNVLG
jgi:hypothetical protein